MEGALLGKDDLNLPLLTHRAGERLAGDREHREDAEEGISQVGGEKLRESRGKGGWGRGSGGRGSGGRCLGKAGRGMT